MFELYKPQTEEEITETLQSMPSDNFSGKTIYINNDEDAFFYKYFIDNAVSLDFDALIIDVGSADDNIISLVYTKANSGDTKLTSNLVVQSKDSSVVYVPSLTVRDKLDSIPEGTSVVTGYVYSFQIANWLANKLSINGKNVDVMLWCMNYADEEV